jgi:hypothetical protein
MAEGFADAIFNVLRPRDFLLPWSVLAGKSALELSRANLALFRFEWKVS